MSVQVIQSFTRTHMRDVLKGSSEGPEGETGKGKKGHAGGQEKAANSEAIKNGTSTLAVGQRARFDTTPVAPDGTEYGGNDERVMSPFFTKPGSDAPIVEWEALLDDGRDLMQDPTNPFELGAYGRAHNNGMTCSLKLNAPLGQGRHRIRFGPKVKADPAWNGGVECGGDRAIFYVD